MNDHRSKSNRLWIKLSILSNTSNSIQMNDDSLWIFIVGIFWNFVMFACSSLVPRASLRNQFKSVNAVARERLWMQIFIWRFRYNPINNPMFLLLLLLHHHHRWLVSIDNWAVEIHVNWPTDGTNWKILLQILPHFLLRSLHTEKG